MSDDLVKELRAGPYRHASETNDQAAILRLEISAAPVQHGRKNER